MTDPKKRWLAVAGKDPETLDELFSAVIKILNHGAKTGGSEVVGFAWDIRYSDRVSNTHCSPLSGVQNFSCKDDKPRGYPGMSGRVWLRLGREINMFGSGLFSGTLTYTGTGGMGSYSGPWAELSKVYHTSKAVTNFHQPVLYSWDYRFFLDDFPLIKKSFGRRETLASIAGEDLVVYHEKLWEDEEQQEKDNKFMALDHKLITEV